MKKRGAFHDMKLFDNRSNGFYNYRIINRIDVL